MNTALARRTGWVKSSPIREMLRLTKSPDIISFAGGMPAPEVFPVTCFREACQRVLGSRAREALQYGPTEGYLPLKHSLIELMSGHGSAIKPENILPTSGSQQALDLIGRAFIDEGDTVITSRPTYLGAIQAWDAYGPKYVTVPLDDDGMCIDALEQQLEVNPGAKLIYVLPNFHNPAGTTLPMERRHRLVQLATAHRVLIVEDDPYGQLRYEGEEIPPLLALGADNTVYTSTFSKTLAPGVRLGWIVAPERVMTKLVQLKQGADLHTSSFIQLVVHDICEGGLLTEHITVVRGAYAERRDAMIKAIHTHFPPEVSWTRPEGGLFIWVRLPEDMDAEDVLQAALEEGVAFVPGNAFFPNGSGGRSCMRLNFSHPSPETIERGIDRLGRIIRRQMERTRNPRLKVQQV